MASVYSSNNCKVWKEGEITYKLYTNEDCFQLFRFRGEQRSFVIIPFEIAPEIGAELIAVPARKVVLP